MPADGFGPGFNGPLLLVAQTPGASDRQALQSLTTRVSGTEGVAAVNALPTGPDAKLSIVQVVPTTSPQSEATAELIQHLRDDVIPPAEKDSTLKVNVGGQTAISPRRVRPRPSREVPSPSAPTSRPRCNCRATPTAVSSGR